MSALSGLPARLLAHADAHSSASPYDEDQAQWESDLREAARLLATSAVFDMDAAAFAAARKLPFVVPKESLVIALTAALPHLMSAAKKEGGEADNLMPDMEALRRDAMRYRFLRTPTAALRRIGRANLMLGNFDEDLDTTIDAALAAQRDTSEGGG